MSNLIKSVKDRKIVVNRKNKNSKVFFVDEKTAKSYAYKLNTGSRMLLMPDNCHYSDISFEGKASSEDLQTISKTKDYKKKEQEIHFKKLDKHRKLMNKLIKENPEEFDKIYQQVYKKIEEKGYNWLTLTKQNMSKVRARAILANQLGITVEGITI